MKPWRRIWENEQKKITFFIALETWPISISAHWVSMYFTWRKVATWKIKTEPGADCFLSLWSAQAGDDALFIIIIFFNPALPYVIAEYVFWGMRGLLLYTMKLWSNSFL